MRGTLHTYDNLASLIVILIAVLLLGVTLIHVGLGAHSTCVRNRGVVYFGQVASAIS